ncbi:MAG: tRNA 2-thiouridine(34) synthase MnmA [Acidobacteria bacterium]|nr:tRNA 2-thiouridine(34) synthase MnmA [Acidobacteriota bacterium]
MNLKRVAVAMSGGVDSSVAAYLLKEEGYEVSGYTLILHGGNEMDKKAVEDSAIIAERLGISHHSLDITEIFRKEIIETFISEYKNGSTPNPCVLCNRKIKFGELLTHIVKNGSDYIATGHYANIKNIDGKHFISKGADGKKDQSYFLYNIKKDVLPKIIFPLGNLHKEEVRKIALKARLPVMDRAESEDACFLHGRSYRELLMEYGINPQKGQICLADGTVLGEHEGYYNFTIGQRKGLRVAYSEPLYVLNIIPPENRVIVGTKEETFSKRFTVKNLNMHFDPPGGEFSCITKIRYRNKGTSANVNITGEKTAAVELAEPQSAVTPGQSSVFYDGDIVLGGGLIEKVFL